MTGVDSEEGESSTGVTQWTEIEMTETIIHMNQFPIGGGSHVSRRKNTYVV